MEKKSYFGWKWPGGWAKKLCYRPDDLRRTFQSSTLVWRYITKAWSAKRRYVWLYKVRWRVEIQLIKAKMEGKNHSYPLGVMTLKINQQRFWIISQEMSGICSNATQYPQPQTAHMVIGGHNLLGTFTFISLRLIVFFLSFAVASQYYPTIIIYRLHKRFYSSFA